MATTAKSGSSKSRLYEIRTSFRAPLPYVFAWCTDYSPKDSRLEKEVYTRRVLSRTARTVVYEDLRETPKGWMWSHQVVTLRPPNHWHSDAIGSHRFWNLDYDLRELPDGGTELHLHGLRTPTALGKNPPKAHLERDLRGMWANFGRALERDYRASRKSR